MPERAYTVMEIEALRSVVANKYQWGWYQFPMSCRSMSRSPGNEADEIKSIEEIVRTWMIAGKTAGELLESEKERRDQVDKYNAEADAAKADKAEKYRGQPAAILTEHSPWSSEVN